MIKHLEREEVMESLEKAFRRVGEFDYGRKYTHLEEDLRASLYRYVRDFLDVDDHWRIFLSYMTGEKDVERNKPDMIFTFGEPIEHAQHKLEILVEMKNWPRPNTKELIKHDCEKMIKISKLFPESKPDMYFLGIIGDKYTSEKVKKLEDEISEKYNNERLHVILLSHRDLYEGPWENKEKTDPWKRLLQRTE